MAGKSPKKAAATHRPRRVVLVDDHPVLRDGLTRLINSHDDLAVEGAAASAEEALAMIERLQPDIVMVDISLEGSSGLDLIKDIKLRWPTIPVLVLSMHEEDLYAERAIRAGARGYITKQEATSRVITAIRQVLDGHVYLSEKMTRRMLEQVSGTRATAPRWTLESLSDRELQVFEFIGRGKNTREIAETLKLSVRTIETYKDHIKSKLKLKHTTELIKQAAVWVESNLPHRL